MWIVGDLKATCAGGGRIDRTEERFDDGATRLADVGAHQADKGPVLNRVEDLLQSVGFWNRVMGSDSAPLPRRLAQPAAQTHVCPGPKAKVASHGEQSIGLDK